MIDEKDLIELAKSTIPEDNDPVKDMHPDILDFIVDCGMVEDPQGCVDLRHIHWTYVKWAQFRNKEVLSNIAFGKEIHKKFKKRKSFRRITYFVNKEPFTIDDKEIWVMGAYYREKKEYGKKKANKRKASRAAKAIQQPS